MAFVVAALEVSDKIQTVGAFAGFAAILGLAVLSVLYFGQAREVKRLREWAGRAPERAAEMQDRVATDASKRVVAQPVGQQQQPPPQRPPATQPATPGAAAAGAKTAPAPMPAAAKPATPTPGEVTQVKPADGTDQPTVLQPSVAGAGAAGAATAAGAAGAAGAAAGPAGAAAPPAGGTPAAPPASTPAAPPAGGTPAAPAGSGGTAAPPAGATPPAPKPPAGGPATAAGRPAPAVRPEPAAPLRSARASREAQAATQATPSSPSSSPAGATIAIIAAVGAILVAIVLVVTGVIGGSDDPESARNLIVPTAPEPTTSTNGTAATAVNRGSVSVVVLNGTGVPNLAREAAGKLGGDGYKLAAAGNRGDATVGKTVVLYAPGQQRAARDVQRLLKVGTVGPLDAGTEVVAQTHVKPTGGKPEVVVTLGADAAQT